MTKVFRVKHDKRFTVMSNFHLLDDRGLSLKAKAMISIMLALPETWEYTIKGLATLCRDGVDSVRSTLKEIEAAGYLKKSRLRGENGQFSGTEYIIYEQPISVTAGEAASENIPEKADKAFVEPKRENPTLEKPKQENPAQLNNNTLRTKKTNTYDSLPQKKTSVDEVKRQIGYDKISEIYSRDYADLCVDVIHDCRNSYTKTISGARVNRNMLNKRFSEINFDDVCNAAQAVSGREIHSARAYMTAVLYNNSITEKRKAAAFYGASQPIKPSASSIDMNSVMEELILQYGGSPC